MKMLELSTIEKFSNEFLWWDEVWWIKFGGQKWSITIIKWVNFLVTVTQGDSGQQSNLGFKLTWLAKLLKSTVVDFYNHS
jgi:hypothetical protein